MEFPSPAYTTFVLPTGATSGQRIVFNENGDGTIKVYNSANVLIAEVAASLPVIGVPDQGGFKVLSGSNTATLTAGQMQFTINTVDYIEAPSIYGAYDGTGNTATALTLSSGEPTADDIHGGEPARMDLWSGDTTTRPLVQVYAYNNGNGPLDVDHLVQGDAYVKNAIRKNNETWNTPTYQTGYSGTTTFTGISPVKALRYRKTAEDELWLYGCFTISASGATAIVFTLPSGYFDTTAQSGFPLMCRPAAGLPMVMGFGYVSTAGAFHVDTGAGFSRALGDSYFVNAYVPLGNLP